MAKTARELAALFELLGHDERAVMEWVLVGAVQGRKAYGELNIATDPRDWRVETLQEIRDGLFYLACQVLRMPVALSPVATFEGRGVGEGTPEHEKCDHGHRGANGEGSGGEA